MGRIAGAGGSPAISAGIVSPASVNNAVAVKSAPVNHLTVGPNCGVTPARIGRISDAGGCPGISAGIVSPASLRNEAAVISAPVNHLTAGPNCRVVLSRSGRIGGAGGCPTVRGRVVSPASIKVVITTIVEIRPAPDDHLSAGPNCRVGCSRIGRIDEVGGGPAISAGIVSSAGIRPVGSDIIKISAPDDHLNAGPNCRVPLSPIGRIDGAGGCPTVGAGNISPAGIQPVVGAIIKISAPDDHLSAGPNCRVKLSVKGRIGGAAVCPGVIYASIRVRNLWKKIGNRA